MVNKAAGAIVQGAQGSLLHTLKMDLELPALFPVHRLDQGTSGLVLFAKTPLANKQLSFAFQQREVQKFYFALTSNKPKKKQGWVIGDMAKSRNGSYKLLRSQTNPAKTAFFSFALGGGQRLVALKIYTGKTHQIRVALRALAAPVLGDERYGGAVADRMYLHAAQIQFTLDNERFDYYCPPTAGSEFLEPACVAKVAEIGVPAELLWPQK